MKETKQLPGITREAEEQYLARTIGVAEQNLERNLAGEKKLADDLHDLMESYGAKDVEALSMLHNTQIIYEETKRDRERCERARKKPYFGRIDFYDEDLKKDEAFYIGRVGISENITGKVVIDWRAPVASVYYENALGRCTYSVKNEKTYEIDLHRKRTYEIEDDQLKDFYDSDVVANDELLTKYLAKNKKAVLGEIIATIQQEQNAVIRKSPKQNVIVQGGAGSGKTTVAMHRISYILYNYAEEFRPEDFYIIGSNRILLNYITGVLPDLDVYGIRQMTMEQLFTRLLYEDWDEKEMTYHALGKTSQAAAIKGSLFWFQNLEAYCNKLEEDVIDAHDIFLGNKLLLEEQAIRAFVEENPQTSVQNKILMLNRRLMAKIENEITGKEIAYTPEEKRTIQRNFRFYFGPKEWKLSIFTLYREFLEEQKLRGYQVECPENDYDVYDLAALAYLYKRVKETEEIREASHIVIDEAQDFGMMAYSVLKYCVRGCTYTIMGDVSQNIYYGYGLNDWETLRKLILTGPYDTFELLKKSYRNTIEISDFAMKILHHGNFPIYPVKPIIRHGKEVSMEQYADEKELYGAVGEHIERWKKEGLETIAIVCRDEKEAKKAARKLGKKVTLLGDEKEQHNFGSGAMVLPVAYTKGLEFDAVLLLDPSEKKYPYNDANVKLLYVAATRALHELSVCYLEGITGIIADPVPEREQKLFKEETAPKRRSIHEMRGKLRERRAMTETTADAREQTMPQRIAADRKRAAEAVTTIRAAERLENVCTEEATKKTQPIARVSGMSDNHTDRKSALPRTEPASTRSSAVTGTQREPDNSGGYWALSRHGISQNPRKNRFTPDIPAGNSVASQKQRPLQNTTSVKQNTPALLKEHAALLSQIPSMHHFGEIPSNDVLRPAGHGKIDTAVRWVQKQDSGVACVSSYGVLHITPVAEDIVRVTFGSGTKIQELFAGVKAQTASKMKEGRDAITFSTGKITVQIGKKTGALTFFDASGRKLLAEKDNPPRQVDTVTHKVWNYFDWTRQERLSAKGVLKDDRLPLKNTAKYICYGTKSKRFPLLHSNTGYGIAVAADSDVLCCNIPMYGPYVSAWNIETVDYYFIAASGEEQVIERYISLMNGTV